VTFAPLITVTVYSVKTVY